MFKVFNFRDEDVSLDNPDIVFRVVENAPDNMAYFGLAIARNKEDEMRGRKKKSDTFHTRYNLKKRPYLGPTSTDHELAFLMVN